ncbi:MAG: DUF1360 domain-containing protein [Microthrixaceae bacterium]|nr:DUF1360 domain-containing protein [Microthrixaceae bacterium]
MDALDYALGAVATARLARLVTRDSIFDTPRLKYVQAMDRGGHPKLAELAVCPWCISVWIGAAVAAAGHGKAPGYRLATSALAFSLAAGVINELGSEGDDD